MSYIALFLTAFFGMSLGVSTALAQTEILVPPTSVEEQFILTEEFVDLPTELANLVSYPVWQKVGMNGLQGAVPANWCRPLLLTKPWLIDPLGHTLSQAEQDCWLGISLVTAEIENIVVPDDSQKAWTTWWDTFWRNRPEGSQYWVPAFSVTEAQYRAFVGAESSAVLVSDPSAVANKIRALEVRMSEVETLVERTTQNVAANTTAISDLAAIVQDRKLGLTEAEVDARIDAKLPAITAGQSVVPTLFGYRWDSWILALVSAVVLLFGFVLFNLMAGRYLRRQDQQRLAALEVIAEIQIERDMKGRYQAPPGFEKLLNGLKEGESIPLNIRPVGQGAAIPKVNVIRDVDQKRVPILRLEGVTPGQNIIHAKKVGGQWCFRLVQLWLRLDEAEKGGLVEGLGKPVAVPLGTMPGSGAAEPPEDDFAVRLSKTAQSMDPEVFADNGILKPRFLHRVPEALVNR